MKIEIKLDPEQMKIVEAAVDVAVAKQMDKIRSVKKRLKALEDAADRSWTEPRFIGDKNV